MANHSLTEELSPNVQSELLLTQLHSIYLCPIAGHQREISTSLSASPLEEVVDYNEVTPQPSLSQVKANDISCSSEVLPSRPFTILAALLWICSNSLMSLY